MELSLLDLRAVVFLVLLVLAQRLTPRSYRPAVGMVGSAVLIGFASMATLVVVTALTLLYLYPVHLAWRRWGVPQRRPSAPSAYGFELRSKKPGTKGAPAIGYFVVGAGVAGIVALFLLFKLVRQFPFLCADAAWARNHFLAVVGFSYFSLRAINFLQIQTILDIEERRPWHLLYFMLFPPTITSGPIQKFQDFRAQVTAAAPVASAEVLQAIYRITRGYFRKLVLAYVAYESFTALMEVESPNAYVSMAVICLLYLYFYFDFAGYSDIAIGFGALMGIRVPENFRTPFLATSVTEFWRHWHITLVDWFRDSVFIPLGGMRASRRRAALLGLLVMVLCGLWHGLSVNFLAWGCWHGMLLLGEGMLGSKPVPPARRRGPVYWARVFRTNALVALGAVFFLPDLAAIRQILGGLIRWT